MCRSMADIRSTAAEIRRGKKKKKEERRKKKETTGQKYNAPLLHRAAIKMHLVTDNGETIVCGRGLVAVIPWLKLTELVVNVVLGKK